MLSIMLIAFNHKYNYIVAFSIVQYLRCPYYSAPSMASGQSAKVTPFPCIVPEKMHHSQGNLFTSFFLYENWPGVAKSGFIYFAALFLAFD